MFFLVPITGTHLLQVHWTSNVLKTMKFTFLGMKCFDKNYKNRSTKNDVFLKSLA